MKKLLIILSLFMITFSCSKDAHDTSHIATMFSLEATGDLSEQSVEEAKKTIYGKWDFSFSSSSRRACKLFSLEFTGQNYFMKIGTASGQTLSGKYTLGEDASGKVEKVELKNISDDSSEILIAVLTNLVVTKTGDDLNATFNIVLSFPSNSGESFSSCNDALSGKIEAKKAKPMVESKNASADSNHAKFIGTWQMASIAADDNGKKYTLEDFFKQECKDDETGEIDEGCIIPSKWFVEITPYGTYATLYTDANGVIIDNDSGTWRWKDNTQKVFITDDTSDDYNEDTGGDENTITSISTSEMTVATDGASFTLKKVQ